MGSLRSLARLGRALKKLEDPAYVRDAVKPVFQDALMRADRAFYNKLRRNSVSGAFRDTLATRLLRNAFNKDIGTALRTSPKTKGLRFALSIRSSGSSSTHGDPAAYYDAIDNASTRRGGPSLERVKQWLYERGLIRSPTQKNIYLENGRRISLARFAYLVQSTIYRKTRTRNYKSLELTKTLQRVINIENPNSPVRKALATVVSKALQQGWRQELAQ